MNSIDIRLEQFQQVHAQQFFHFTFVHLVLVRSFLIKILTRLNIFMIKSQLIPTPIQLKITFVRLPPQ
jgi:hypothetical protein